MTKEELWQRYPIRCTTKDTALFELRCAMNRLDIIEQAQSHPQIEVVRAEIAHALNYFLN